SCCGRSLPAPKVSSDLDQTGVEELHRVIAPQGVVDRPTVRRARAQHLIERKGDAPRGALHLRQARVEHLPRPGHADLLGHLGRRRDALHEDAELVRRPVLERLELAHDAVAAVDGVVELVAILAEALAHLVARPGDDLVHVPNGVRVADADHADVALADLARALELDAEFRRRLEARAGDARGLLRHLLVAALGHVERAAGDVLEVRIRSLVHGVPGDGGNGAALIRMHRSHPHLVGGHFAEHGFLAAIRLGAERGAFEDLAQVIGLRLRKAVVDRRRGENAAVGAAPADDHVGALLQELEERMNAGHGDDPLGRIQFNFRQILVRIQAQDALARPHLPAHVLLVDFGIKVAELEAPQAVLLGELLDDAHVEIDAAVRAGVAGRTDNTRRAGGARGEQHLLEVVRLPREGTGRSVAAERDRADVVAPGVRRDVVGARSDAELEALDADRCETEVAVRTDDLQTIALHDDTRLPQAAFPLPRRRGFRLRRRPVARRGERRRRSAPADRGPGRGRLARALAGWPLA